MIKKITLILSAGLFCILQACSSGSVTIVRNGKPSITILVDSSILPLDKPPEIVRITERGEEIIDPSGEMRRAVNKLIFYINKMSGAELQVKAASPGAKGCYVGLDRNFTWLDYDLNELGNEGFTIRTKGSDIYLLASEPAGIRHAITTFLTDQGCRWFFPGKVWEVVPEKPTIRVKYDLSFSPGYNSGRTLWYGYGTYPEPAKDQAEWNYHNHMGGPVSVSIGHSWYGIDPEKDFIIHPEWFALVKGKRTPSKVCYSNTEVIRKMIEYSLEQASKGALSVSLSPADGLGYCECDLCKAWAQGGDVKEEMGSFFATRPDGRLVCIVSETLFNAVNEVARELGRKYPDVLIGCYGYSAYSHPPSFKLEPNVFIQTTTEFRRTPLSLEEQIDLWGKCAKQVGIRGYWSVYQWDWDNPVVGKFTPESIQKDLRFYYSRNTKAFNTEASNNWAARGLSYYIGAQLLWDIDADVNAMISDFYEKAFGPAAMPMQSYYMRWYGPSVAVLEEDPEGKEENKPETKPDLNEFANSDPRGSMASVRSLAEAFRDLDKAAELVRDRPEYLQRVNHLRLYALYLLYRQKVKEAAATGDSSTIIEAIKNETVFGGKLANTNMIHAKPLLGKAFMRLFREYEPLLKDLPECQAEGTGWRQTGDPPTGRELEQLWDQGKKSLGL
jgi:hypothetical protein